jgi:hypothetical protein
MVIETTFMEMIMELRVMITMLKETEIKFGVIVIILSVMIMESAEIKIRLKEIKIR